MRVHILGGGIGGMSAALHLGRLSAAGVMPHDLEVHVYDRLDRLGGKAVSQLSERDGAGRWPGEHGFRFFPNFYRCIVDTLKYVPVTAAHKARRGLDPELGPTVFDLLESVGESGAALGGAVHHIPRAQSLDGIVGAIRETLSAFHVTPLDIATFSAEITRFLCTCNDRALLTWEHDTLQGFLARHDFSPGMVTFFRSLRALSAMRADKGSLRTLFFTATQMIADFDPEYHLRDALLPGPTDYLMLEPWADELERLGVLFHPRHAVTALSFGESRHGLPSRLTSVELDGATARIEAGPDDVFVLALPFEVARPLLVAAPNLPVTLEGVHQIAQRPDNLGDGAEPMVGVQFWLKRDVPIASGHVVYPTAQWAITSVSQAQFWRDTFAASLEDTFAAPGLRGILSAIVSGWEVESDRIHKAPKNCTSGEGRLETRTLFGAKVTPFALADVKAVRVYVGVYWSFLELDIGRDKWLSVFGLMKTWTWDKQAKPALTLRAKSIAEFLGKPLELPPA
jgi:15-cis-phytoene desaturase